MKTLRSSHPLENTRYMVKQVVSIMLFACVLFSSGGTIAWIEGWLYLGALVLIGIANTLAMDPHLRTERSRMQEGTKQWDILLSTITALAGPLVVLATSGFDHRFDWSSPFSPLRKGMALIVLLFGAGIATWAMHTNRFFSATVRIQHERKHTVVDSGPYRYIRHPGYLGGIIGNLAVPLLLGSIAGLCVGICVASGVIVRTALEDRTLMRDLDGYEAYANRVRYRLFPPFW